MIKSKPYLPTELGVNSQAASRGRALVPSGTETMILAVISLAVAARTVFAVFADVEALTFRTTDDSYYYFNVARHIVHGQGITFDGINETNGFHPLWMVILLPVFFVTQADAESGLRLVTVLVAMISGITFWACFQTVREFSSTTAGMVAVCALIGPWFLNPLLNGLETGIMILQLFLLAWSARRLDLFSPRTGIGKDVFLGTLLAILFLTRLDTIFIVLAVFFQIGWRWARSYRPEVPFRAVLRKFLVTGGVALGLVMPYILWNLMRFGHAVPISGALKSSFPVVSFESSRLMEFHSFFGKVELSFSLLFLIGVLVTRTRRGTRTEKKPRRDFADWDILIAMCTGSTAHFVYSMLFMSWAAWWWHYASYIPLTVICGALLFDRCHQRFLTRPTVAALTVVTVLSVSAFGLALEARRRGAHHGPWLQAARWCNDNLPSNAVVGMTDCGLFGYFCERPTINLDGVINSYAFQRALRDGDLDVYLAECGVTHIADYEVLYRAGQYVIEVPARLHKRPGCAIITTPGAEVFRSDPYQNAFDSGIHFAVFEMASLQIIDRSAG